MPPVDFLRGDRAGRAYGKGLACHTRSLHAAESACASSHASTSDWRNNKNLPTLKAGGAVPADLSEYRVPGAMRRKVHTSSVVQRGSGFWTGAAVGRFFTGVSRCCRASPVGAASEIPVQAQIERLTASQLGYSGVSLRPAPDTEWCLLRGPAGCAGQLGGDARRVVVTAAAVLAAAMSAARSIPPSNHACAA